jgi:beta-N-acetylhexosaminidase
MKKIAFILGVATLAAVFAGVRDHRNKELDRMVGQMILVGFRGKTSDDIAVQELARNIKEGRVGGVILFSVDVARGREYGMTDAAFRTATKSRNIVNVDQVRELNEYLSAAARRGRRPSLFISIDQEGGRVARLGPEHGFDFAMPSARELAAMRTPEQVGEMYYELGANLRKLGFNLNFAPVVDVDVNPDSPAIGRMGRSFSNDPQRVAEYARAAAQGLSRAGIIYSYKHFPGHGSASGDTHVTAVDITGTWDALELEPYRALAHTGMPGMVMTAHVTHTAKDENFPASMSEKIIGGILRDDIGYDGVVISDDLQMGAIYQHFGLREALKRSILAGNDIMLLGNNLKHVENLGRVAHEEIVDLVRTNEIPRAKIKESYRRIMELKKNLRD